MQPSLDILANHRDSNQWIAENETRQGAAMVRTLGRRIVRVELNPIRVVDFEEESEAVRADLGAHGGLESGAIGDVEEGGEANCGDEGVEAGEDCGVGGFGGGGQAGAAIGF